MNEEMLASRVKTMQVVALALASGVTIFLLIALLVLRSGTILGENPWSVKDPLVLVGVLMALSVVPMSLFLPRMLDRQTLQTLAPPAPGAAGATMEDLENRLAAAYQSRMIVSNALVEGVGLANGIFYFLTGSGISLLCAVLCIALLWMKIPTRSQVQDWMSRMREEMIGSR
jgi:hypothetical protein